MIGGGMLSICWAKEDESSIFSETCYIYSGNSDPLGSFQIADDLERPFGNLGKDQEIIVTGRSIPRYSMSHTVGRYQPLRKSDKKTDFEDL